MTIREWLNDRVTEPIEAITFGTFKPYWSSEPDPLGHLCDKLYSAETMEEAAPIIDREFDDSFGTSDTYPVMVWTKDYVYFSDEYDGSDFFVRVPRNPLIFKEHK